MGEDKYTEHKTKPSSITVKLDEVYHKKKIRMVVWGGFNYSGDWWSFHDGRVTVVRYYDFTPHIYATPPTDVLPQINDATKNAKQYNAEYELIDKPVATGKEVVELINQQENDSIRSLDTFFHGNYYGLSMSTAPHDTPLIKDKGYRPGSPQEKENFWARDYLAGLYMSYYQQQDNLKSYERATRSGMPVVDNENSSRIAHIDFHKFTENAKIEIHGCKAADGYRHSKYDGGAVRVGSVDQGGVGKYIHYQYELPSDNNIAAALSVELYKAGKTKSVVIAHVTQSSINKANDYRHGKRIVYHNGRAISEITDSRIPTEDELEELVEKL